MSGFEVIDAVAAAGQFIEQTIAIAKLIHAVRGKVRDAPAEIQQWHDELETLGAIASRIQATAALQTPQIENILLRCSAHS